MINIHMHTRTLTQYIDIRFGPRVFVVARLLCCRVLLLLWLRSYYPRARPHQFLPMAHFLHCVLLILGRRVENFPSANVARKAFVV